MFMNMDGDKALLLSKAEANENVSRHWAIGLGAIHTTPSWRRIQRHIGEEEEYTPQIKTSEAG